MKKNRDDLESQLAEIDAGVAAHPLSSVLVTVAHATDQKTPRRRVIQIAAGRLAMEI